MNSGIYKINNKINKKFYIGSAVNIKNRWYVHKLNLNKNIHINKHLQRAWNKYGEHNFEFIIVELMLIEKLKCAEQLLLDKYCGKNYCYNISLDVNAPMRGRKHTTESNIKRSNALKGRTLTEEHKQKIGQANKGNIFNDVARKNMSEAHKGKVLTSEQKQKISNALKGENGPIAKLTNDKVKQIRELYSQGGTSLNKLAVQFDVSKKTILNVVHRRIWVDV